MNDVYKLRCDPEILLLDNTTNVWSEFTICCICKNYMLWVKVTMYYFLYLMLFESNGMVWIQCRPTLVRYWTFLLRLFSVEMIVMKLAYYFLLSIWLYQLYSNDTYDRYYIRWSTSLSCQSDPDNRMILLILSDLRIIIPINTVLF